MQPTERFTTRAGSYVAARPSYPRAAIEAIVEGLGDPATLTVGDLGAGTGISSRLLAELGPHVLAIEPNAAMRAAAAHDPRVEWIDGTAEATTLPDASLDVLSAFQAWHWFDHPRVTVEARRVVRKGGRLAVVYNERDETDAFTAQYGDIVRRYAKDATERRRATALAHALGIDPERTTREEFRNSQTLDRAGVHARADSSSYLPQSGPEATAMHEDIDKLLDHFGVTGTIETRLLTVVVRVEL